MKKIIFISLLTFFISHINAQVSEYISCQSAIIKKSNNDEFQFPNEWFSKKMKIILDLNNKKLQLLSTDLSGQNPGMLEQEIHLYRLKAKSTNIGNTGFATFTGTDKSGEKCIVRFNFKKKINDIYDGILQIEYPDTQWVYKIRKEQI